MRVLHKRSLFNEIMDAAAREQLRTGAMPDRVYLGTENMARLWAESEDDCGYATSAVPGPELAEVYGMRVYLVADDPNHLRCC